MHLCSRTGRLFLIFAVCGGCSVAHARQTSPQASPSSADPAQTSAPLPKGKVLFERHEPVVTGEPPGNPVPSDAEAPPAVNPTGKPGISSSSKRSRTTLHRHDEQQPAADANAPAAAASGASATSPEGISSSGAGEVIRAPISLTAQDRENASRISAAERSSILITALDLDLHLNAHNGDVETRAQVTVRNTGEAALPRVTLRISGALRWESARLAGAAALPLEQHHLPDDLDHTGVSTELAIALAHPLEPGASAALDLYYAGPLSSDDQRLLNLGAPAGRALATDWDTVTDTFTGLRGLGNVMWYPTATAPALLRNGPAVTDAVEESRRREAGSSFRLRLTLAYEGSRPDAAFFCGERQPLKPLVAELNQSSDSGAVVAEWTRSPLGPHTPSLFVAAGAPAGTGTVRVMTGDPAASLAVEQAVDRVRPMLAEWLGAAPERPLQVLDLPIPGAAAFADGPLLVVPLTAQSNTAALSASLVQPLANAWLPDGIAAPWLRDGLPAFLQSVWAERTQGRSVALANLAATDASLRARSEPAPSAVSSSQEQAAPTAALATCTDAACTRGKAAYAFEMLRSMLGDAALQQAISGWRVQAEGSRRTAAEETIAMEKLLQQVAGSKDVGWFFRNWIDAGRALPDLAIVTVAPRRVERSAPVNYLPQARTPVAGPIGSEPAPQTDDRRAGQTTAAGSGGTAPAPGSWLVAVEVQNNGGTDVEVPVTVRNGSLTNTLPLRVAAGSRATIRVPFEAEPEEVLVNDGSVPEAHTTQHRRSVRNLPPVR